MKLNKRSTAFQIPEQQKMLPKISSDANFPFLICDLCVWPKKVFRSPLPHWGQTTHCPYDNALSSIPAEASIIQ